MSKVLQKFSAHEGLENDLVYNYCKRLVNLVKQLEGNKIDPLLQPLTIMLSERQTIADKILSQAKKAGYTNKKKLLPQSVAQEIALTHSKQMFEDIIILEQMIEANAALS